MPGAGAGTGVPTNAFNSFSSTNTEPPAANVFRFAPARFTFDESIEPSRYTTSPGPGFKSGSVAVDLPGAPAFAVTVGDLPSLKIATGLKTKNVIPSATPITTLNAAPIVTSVQLGSYSPRLNPENITSKNQDLAAGADGAAGLLGVASGVPLFFVVGDIETRALEDEPGAAADQTLEALFLHFGHFFSGSSRIDWNCSNS